MTRARDILRQARTDVHDGLGVRAIYLTAADAEPQVVTVRTHTRTAEIGAGDGAPQGLPEILDTTPRVRFLRSEVSQPKTRSGLVLLAADEGYRLMAVRPAYNLTIDAEVADLDAADLATHWKAEYATLLGEAAA